MAAHLKFTTEGVQHFDSVIHQHPHVNEAEEDFGAEKHEEFFVRDNGLPVEGKQSAELKLLILKVSFRTLASLFLVE